MGYYGAKMKSPQELFTRVGKNVQTPAAGSNSQKVIIPAQTSTKWNRP